jgi:hypothetical protein
VYCTRRFPRLERQAQDVAVTDWILTRRFWRLERLGPKPRHYLPRSEGSGGWSNRSPDLADPYINWKVLGGWGDRFPDLAYSYLNWKVLEAGEAGSPDLAVFWPPTDPTENAGWLAGGHPPFCYLQWTPNINFRNM